MTTKEEVISKLDTKFLKEKRYKESGVAMDQLMSDFKAFVSDELLVDRPDLIESGDIERIQSVAERAFSASKRRQLAGAATRGELVILGLSRPFDYIGAWKVKAGNLYSAAKKKADAGNPAELQKLIADGIVDITGTPLELRDNKKDAKGKAYASQSGYIGSLCGTFTERTGQKRSFVVTITLGGESNDTIINMRCPKCGTESVYKICPGRIKATDKTGKPIEIKCNEKKQLYEFETIARNVFNRVNTSLKITESEKGMTIAWSPSTEIREPSLTMCVCGHDKAKHSAPKGADATADLKCTECDCKKFAETFLKPAEVERLLTTTLKSKVVRGVDLAKAVKDHVNDKNYWCVYRGTVSEMQVKKPDKKGNLKVLFDDDSLSMKTADGKTIPGVAVYIPEHVWEFGSGKCLSLYSDAIVIGKPSRREQYDFTARKVITGKYQDPEIEAWGIFILFGERSFVVFHIRWLEESHNARIRSGIQAKDVAPGKIIIIFQCFPCALYQVKQHRFIQAIRR